MYMIEIHVLYSMDLFHQNSTMKELLLVKIKGILGIHKSRKFIIEQRKKQLELKKVILQK